VWVFASKLCRYDKNSDNFVSYNQQSKNHIVSDEVYSIGTDCEGVFYVLGNKGLEKFNYSTHRFDLIEFLDKSGKKINIQVPYSISIDNNKNIWLFFEKEKKLIQGKIYNSSFSRTSFLEIQNEYSFLIPEFNY